LTKERILELEDVLTKLSKSKEKNDCKNTRILEHYQTATKNITRIMRTPEERKESGERE
jgi:hypothetical protein